MGFAVIYPEAGGFMYRGTPQQHAKVNDLIQVLGPLSEFNDEVVYEFYKLGTPRRRMSPMSSTT